MESSLPHIPELVIDKILRLLPTKSAFQSCFLSDQWQDVVFSSPTLNFDENDDFERHDLPSLRKHHRSRVKGALNHHIDLHEKFILFLRGYLLSRNPSDPVDKLRLRMRMYSAQTTSFSDNDKPVIHELLEYACRRNLKELDISMDFQIKPYLTATEHLIETKRPLETKFHDDFYLVHLWYVSMSGNSLTRLNLGCVKIPEIPELIHLIHVPPLFPCLKIMSLKVARFVSDEAPYRFLRECPSIEHLTLSYCSFKNSKLHVSNSSLKYLEVKYCEVDDVRVYRASNLEYFSFISLRDSNCKTMMLKGALSLKHVDVMVDKNIGEFSLVGCHHALEASIKSKRINNFEFFDGSSSVALSFKADSNHATIKEATMLDEELINKVGFSSNQTYVPRLVSFTQNFGCCKITSICNGNVQTLTMPKPNGRKSSSATMPLRKMSTFDVRLPEFGSTDKNCELLETLRSIAPCAKYLGRTTTVDLK